MTPAFQHDLFKLLQSYSLNTQLMVRRTVYKAPVCLAVPLTTSPNRSHFHIIDMADFPNGLYTITNASGQSLIGRNFVEDLSLMPKRVLRLPSGHNRSYAPNIHVSSFSIYYHLSM